ncbi:MAG: hypothetical protein JSR00_04000 [Bacteroidetes bacterium]|nr:hypothetical protein [Bacteroidota bacterium]
MDNTNKKPNNNISKLERDLIDDSQTNQPSVDNNNLRESQLDLRDEDGTLLNENSGGRNYSGDDLDVPGASLDDAEEAIGEEDEENNSYSDADTDTV